MGFKVYIGIYVLLGVERGILRKFGGVYLVEIMVYIFRMFG